VRRVPRRLVRLAVGELMTTYDLTIDVDDRDRPGMQAIVDMVYDGMIDLGAREGYLQVEVKGPPELRIVGVLR
jgi:hypothetical protein